MNNANRLMTFAPLNLLFCSAVLVLATAMFALAQSAAKPELTAADCVKCHQKEAQEIDAKGASHKTKVDCRECHAGHRPKVANNIPECNDCHSGSAHYKVQGCKLCHNPHAPLDIDFKGEIREACLTCHVEPGEELAANPSKHAKLACNFCHADKHGNIPACTDCHEPHSAKMTAAECGSCHQAHMPLAVTFSNKTLSLQCAACHDQAFNLLQASPAKHRELACVACHAGKHKSVPACNDCHGFPHAAGMHKLFPKCGGCHNIAHDLNNWPAKKETKGNKGTKSQPGTKK